MKRVLKVIRKYLSGFIIMMNLRRIIIAIFSIIALLYLVFSLAAPARKINYFNQLGTANLANVDRENPRIYKHPEFFDLNKNKTFLESRLLMSENDSIGISVNLRDSTIGIEIKGITLHQVKIHTYKSSRLFRAIDNQVYMAIFSSPLSTELQNATIKKEPVIYKKAPRDTIEAAKSLLLPDTTKENPVYISLTLKHGLRLFIEQERAGSFKALITKAAFRARNSMKQAWINFHHALRFKVPPYSPVIKIGIPARDAETIYHALPANAMVSIRI